MLKVILLFAIASILSCKKDYSSTLNNPIKLDTFIVNNYSKDAKSLYLKEIISDSSHANFNEPILDTTEITNILKIIQAVYNSKSLQRDTIFNVYKIHGYYCYSFKSITLKVKPDLPEIKNLAIGIIPTGNTDLDNILTKFRFDSVKTSYSYPSFPWLTIYTNNEYNMIPLEKEFSKLPQVDFAEFNKGCVGDGNNISLIRKNNSATITFSIGSGDCPAGCIYHKYWEFKVANGIAEFVRTYAN